MREDDVHCGNNKAIFTSTSSLCIISEENQEMNLQGTNIQKNNNVVQSTGITYIYMIPLIYKCIRYH